MNSQNKEGNPKRKKKIQKVKKKYKKDSTQKNKDNFPLISIQNFSKKIKLTEIFTLFKRFGRVEKINTFWIKNQEFICKVYFQNQESAEEAKEFYHEAELDDKILQIELISGQS